MPMHSLEVAPAGWRAAGRRLVAKMLSELTYEDLLQPAHLGDARYLLELPHAVTYRFSARRRLFDSWRVEAESVERIVDGVAGPADDPLRLVVDAREAIGIAPDTAARLVHELATTLLADAEIADRGSLATDVLAELDYARLEGEMTGHPWIVFNKGRLGFGECDRRRYAPESRRPQPLPWIAIHEEISTYNAVCGLDHPRLLDFELDTVTRARFVEAIRERGDPDRYRLLPVHPWQWDRMVLPLLASEIAEGRIVPLGEGPDRYLPQQSIRTFTNVASPLRHHVKLALSVLNTAVYRGLPKRPTALAPRVTAYMRRLRDADPYLRDECRVAFLGEVASVTCDHPVLDAIPGAPYQYREVLGCIWREPIAGELAIGERARTLAALLRDIPRCCGWA